MYGPNLSELMKQHESTDDVSLESLPSLEACLEEADSLVETDLESLEAIDWGTVAKYAITAVIVGAYITMVYRQFKKVKKIRDSLHKHAVKVMAEGGSIAGQMDPSKMRWLDALKDGNEIIAKATQLGEFQYVHPLIDNSFKDIVNWSQISNRTAQELLLASELPAFDKDSVSVLLQVKEAVETAVEAVRQGNGFDPEAFRKAISLKSGSYKDKSGLQWLSTLREKLTNSNGFVLEQKFKTIRVLEQRRPFADFALESIADTNKVLSRTADNAHRWLGDMDKSSLSLNNEISDTLKMFEDLASSGATSIPTGASKGTGLVVHGGETIISGDLSKQEELLDKSRKDLVKVFASAGKYGSTVLDFTGVVAKSQLTTVIHAQREQLDLMLDLKSLFEALLSMGKANDTPHNRKALSELTQNVSKFKKSIAALDKIAKQYK